MRVISPGRFILVVCLAVAGPLDAQATHAGVNKPLSRVEPTCQSWEFIFETFDGRHICCSPRFNPCNAGQVLDRTAAVARCKPSKHPPIACPKGQIPFQSSNGKQTCIASGSNPCPQGQELDFDSEREFDPTWGVTTCKALRAKAPFTCPAGQIAFQRSDGKMLCIAPDSNPCPQGQALDKTPALPVASCKALPAKAPFTCPAGQIAFQGSDGKMLCIAPDSNPCPRGQLLDKAAMSGIASCKPLSAKAPLACPAGQVRVQQPDGKFVCVASP